MNNQTKIEKFLQKELNSDLKDICIVEYANGAFELFNEYLIKRDDNGVYQVNLLLLFEKHIFSSLKNAVTWCIFHKYKRYYNTKRIEELDLKLSSINISMTQQKKILSKIKDLDHRLIYIAKLHESRIKRNSMLKELTSYINISKKWQTKKFLDKIPK